MIADKYFESNNTDVLYNIANKEVSSSEWVEKSGISKYQMIDYDISSKYIVGHTYYIATTMKFLQGQPESTWMSIRYFPNEDRINQTSITELNKEVKLSGIYKIEQDSDKDKVLRLIYALFKAEGTNETPNKYAYKEHMFVDITSLYERYPYFNTLNAEEQISIVSSKITYTSPGKKIEINDFYESPENPLFLQGNSFSYEIVETDALLNHHLEDYDDPYFDNDQLLKLGMYNNGKHIGSLKIIKGYKTEDQEKSPFFPFHKNILEVHTTSKNPDTTNYWQIGFYFANQSIANRTFIYHIYAKIPEGFSIGIAQNNYGTGSKIEWITDRKGTGDWKEYIVQYIFGSEGNFNTVGYFYFVNDNNIFQENFTVYVACAFASDITDYSEYKFLSINPEINLRMLPSNKLFSLSEFKEKVIEDNKLIQLIPYKDSYEEPDYWYCYFAKNYIPSDSVGGKLRYFIMNGKMVATAIPRDRRFTTGAEWTKEIPIGPQYIGKYLWRKWVYRNTNIYENLGEYNG